MKFYLQCFMICFVVCLAANFVIGQEKPVTLKPEVALGIRNAQLQVLLMEQSQPVKDYLAAKALLQSRYSTALKDSGLDEAKYRFETGSLAVSTIPSPDKK